MASKVETVIFENRSRWRRWLRANHNRRKEIWLVLPKKAASGTSYRVYYDEALEEAICFGWIDSRIRSLDPTRSMVRFSPRKSKIWSRPNLQRTLELLKEGKMTRAGLTTLPEDDEGGSSKRLDLTRGFKEALPSLVDGDHNERILSNDPSLPMTKPSQQLSWSRLILSYPKLLEE